jgi:hypothetical protein
MSGKENLTIFTLKVTKHLFNNVFVPGDVTASNIHPPRTVRHGDAFVHGANVSHAVTGVDDDAREQTLGVQRQHSLQTTKRILS